MVSIHLFLVRGVSCEINPGSYDSGGSSQAGSRDTGIQAAVLACP